MNILKEKYNFEIFKLKEFIKSYEEFKNNKENIIKRKQLIPTYERGDFLYIRINESTCYKVKMQRIRYIEELFFLKPNRILFVALMIKHFDANLSTDKHNAYIKLNNFIKFNINTGKLKIDLSKEDYEKLNKDFDILDEDKDYILTCSPSKLLTGILEHNKRVINLFYGKIISDFFEGKKINAINTSKRCNIRYFEYREENEYKYKAIILFNNTIKEVAKSIDNIIVELKTNKVYEIDDNLNFTKYDELIDNDYSIGKGNCIYNKYSSLDKLFSNFSIELKEALYLFISKYRVSKEIILIPGIFISKIENKDNNKQYSGIIYKNNFLLLNLTIFDKIMNLHTKNKMKDFIENNIELLFKEDRKNQLISAI